MSLKVLHIIDSGGFYGAEAVLVELVREQRRQGIDAVVCSIGLPGEPEKPLEKVLRENGFPCWPERMKAGLNLRAAWQIAQRAKANGFRILHSHGYKGNILFGYMPRFVRGLPLVTTLHGWTSVGSGFSKMRVYEWLDAHSLGFMDGVVVVSEAMLKRPELAGRKLRNLQVICNGITPEVPALDEQDPVVVKLREMRAKGPLIGSIGRLSPEKGYDVLIEAFARVKQQVPNAQLAIIGAGPGEQTLQALVSQNNIADDVWFAGYASDAGRYIRCMDVYANSSHTEGLPITLLEAMRAGVPIVASAVGGIPAALGGGRGGLLCEPGDVEGLASSMADVLLNGARSAAVNFSLTEFKRQYSSVGMGEKYRRWYGVAPN